MPIDATSDPQSIAAAPAAPNTPDGMADAQPSPAVASDPAQQPSATSPAQAPQPQQPQPSGETTPNAQPAPTVSNAPAAAPCASGYRERLAPA
jgi:hypothetical protein